MQCLVAFRKNEYARTCFFNLYITYQFNVDGEFYQRELCTTGEDERTLNMRFGSLNINNLLLTSIAKDLRTSLQPYAIVFGYPAGGGASNTKVKKYSADDYSNFMIGAPFADRFDFIRGISTTGTVQIDLTGEK